MRDALGLLPEFIGPYRVLRAIARGGMAEVFEVQDQSSGEHLALKWLRHKSDFPMKRFNREYEVMNSLNHPNILRVFGYGLFHGLPYMTTELVDGTPVQVYCRDSGRPGVPQRTQNVIRVAHGLALALEHIHTRGLIHRDLKSANLLVLEDGRSKLLDFGAARFVEANEQITREGEFVGTFAYAAPEQLRGEPLDHRSDLYSYGVLLYRMCTGKRPFYADDNQTLARLHVEQAAPRPSTVVQGLPQQLEALLMNLLQKDPEERPESAAWVAAELQRISMEPLDVPPDLSVGGSANRLVGREDQQAELRHFAHASEPGSIAVVVGERGSGRKALREAVLAVLDEGSWRFRAVDFEGRPEALAIADLSALGSGAGTIEDTARALALGDAVQWGEVGTDFGDALHERVRGGAPAVLYLQNLQLASERTFAFVRRLRESIIENQSRVALIADYELSIDSPRARLDALAPAHIVNLLPLDEQDVALLVGALLKRRPPPAPIARRIHAASGGHPAFVEEVVRSLVARGNLAIGGDQRVRLQWARGATDIELAVPAEAQSLVKAEVFRLPADAQRVFEAAALMVEGSVELLARVLDRSEGAVLPSLALLEQRAWVTVQLGRFRCEGMPARIIRKHILPPRRAALLDRLGGFVDELEPGPSQVRLLAGLPGRQADAVASAISLAHDALERDAPENALDALDGIEALLQEPPDELKEQLALASLAKAHALLLARPSDKEAGRALVKARILGRDAGAELATRVALARARMQALVGHYPRYVKYLHAAADSCDATETPALAAVIATRLGEALLLTGQLESAFGWTRRALEFANVAGIPRTISYARTGLARLTMARGRLVEALDIVEPMVGADRDPSDDRGLARALPMVITVWCWQGRFTEAAERLDAMLPALRASQVPTYYFRAVIAAASFELAIGRLGRAQEHVDELASTIRRGEHLHLRLDANVLATRIQLDSGEYASAEASASDWLKRASEPGLTPSAERFRALRGAARWHRGDRETARRDLDAAVHRLRRIGDFVALAEVVGLRARILAEELGPDELFAPVEDRLPEAVMLRLRKQVASAVSAMSGGSCATEVRAAMETLDGIVDTLGNSEAAAMRVHPLMRQLKVLRSRCSAAAADGAVDGTR